MSDILGDITYGPHKGAYLGEQAIGFMLGEEGYFFVDGPSGGGGHSLTGHGFDGIAYNPKTGDLIIYDNKAYARSGNVRSATAIDPEKNLLNNLDETIGHVHTHPNLKDMPHRIKILEQLKKTRAGVAQWIAAGKPAGALKLPGAVKLVVYNAWGNSTGIGAKLAKSGAIEFIDVAQAPKPKPGPFVQQELRRLEMQTERAGQQAAEAIERRVLIEGEKAAAGEAAKIALKRSGFAKVMGSAVKRIVQTKAAKRALSLAPVVGWGFSAKDAYAGVEDIMAGHAYRGIAGIGLAATDVLADVCHLGDLVTGVGGTALSLGIQASTIAGQILLETQRLEEKMEQLQEEIATTGKIPTDDRLANEFGLDEDAIKEVKASVGPQLPSMQPHPNAEPGAGPALDERELIRRVLEPIGVRTPHDNVYGALVRAGSSPGRISAVLEEMQRNGEVELIYGANLKIAWVIRRRMPILSPAY